MRKLVMAKANFVLSRKIGDSLTPFELQTVRGAVGLVVQDASSSNRIIVEGSKADVEAFLKAHSGWNAELLPPPPTKQSLILPMRYASDG